MAAELASIICKAAKHSPTIVGDGVEALMLLDGGHFDLVVADLLLPRAEGVAIALRIRASGAAYFGVPILGIAGKGDVAGTAAMRAAGITEFIQKPFWKGSLRPALDRALAQAL